MKDKNHIEIATNNEDILEANKIAEEVGCDKAVYRGEWQGYKVYSPETEDGEIAYTGLPVMILVKDGKWRLTEGKEIFDCYHAVTKYRFYKKIPPIKFGGLIWAKMLPEYWLSRSIRKKSTIFTEITTK